MDDTHAGGRSDRLDGRRGQTNLDFAFGVSIFLLSLIGILLFVPGMIEPFSGEGQEDTVVANDVADRLSRHVLGSPETPYLLDIECTTDFFAGDANDDCQYAGSTVQERVGVHEDQNLNISIKGNVSTTQSDGVDILCWVETSGSLIEVDTDDNGCSDPGETRLAIGGTPPTDSGTAVTTRRVVGINGRDASLFVELW